MVAYFGLSQTTIRINADDNLQIHGGCIIWLMNLCWVWWDDRKTKTVRTKQFRRGKSFDKLQNYCNHRLNFLMPFDAGAI